jgi:hypothetical protein
MPYSILTRLALLLGMMIATTHVHHSAAQEDGEEAHLAVNNPAALAPAEANVIYDKLRQRLAVGYAAAGLAAVGDYQSWKRYNTSPYLSATHGQRYVNNYANAATGDYGNLKTGQRYPAGSVLAKDSITVTTTGKVFPGALFVMEKLEPGTNTATADWRYVMIIADGSIYGDTIGEEPELVGYCHACHQAKADDDFVFYIPEDYRIAP